MKSLNQVIRIAHSPDADDRLMFWAIKQGRLVSDRFEFDIHEADTQTLNRLSSSGSFDIIAVSAAHYAAIHQIYQPLRMGASVGAGYGPVVVTQSTAKGGAGEPLPSAASVELDSWTLISPGLQTTAHNALKVLGYRFGQVLEVPIQPMSLTFEKLKGLTDAAHSRGEPARVAALIIHEGRLTYESEGAKLQVDLGLAWQERFGCNLPLGINVIRRAMPLEEREYLSAFLRESMIWGLRHRVAFEQEYVRNGLLDREKLQTYLQMYANETTQDILAADREAFDLLISEVVKEQQRTAAKQFSQASVVADWI